MCRMCDDPTLTIADLRAEMFRAIAKHGWMIQFVEEEPGLPAFAYTIGLTGKGLPEFFVEGLSAHESGWLLDALAAQATRQRLVPGDSVTVNQGQRCLLSQMVDVSDLYGALEVYGPGIDALAVSIIR
jgi:hypothetical protein